MLIKIPKVEYKEIIAGGNLNAFLQSYQSNTPLIINKLSPPHRFETFKSFNSLDLWNKLFFVLSTSALNLIGDKARNIRIKENEISISTNGARVLKAEFKKLIIFDDENISGLPLPIKENEDFIILDWIIARSCEKHAHEFLSTNAPLVNKLYFYPSERQDGYRSDIKDLVAISYLNKQQLNDFEYSDTYAKFKAMKMLKELKIKGRKSGTTHYALKLEVMKREIRKAKMNSYEDLPHIKFKYETYEQKTKKSYPRKINELLRRIV